MNENLESLDKTIDSLSEQNKKLDIALYYTHNDLEKAKNMVSGTYKDMYAIKVKFSVSTTYGAFLLFFNIPYCSLMDSYLIISHSYIVDDIKTTSEWRLFEKEMEDITIEGSHDNEMTSKIKNELIRNFTIQMGPNQRAIELKKYLDLQDQIAANRVIQKFIQDKMGFINIHLNVEYEQISSLEMELYSTTSKKIDKDLSSEKEKKDKDPDIIVESDEEDDIDKKDIQLILHGNLVLSPVKGKNISSVETGDRIKVTLDAANAKAVTVAKAFKVYDEGRILPITGRVVSKRHLVNGGYKLFVLIAKGIYVKIEEEEEGIKIAMESPENIEDLDSPKTPLLIAIAVVFFIIIIIVLSLILR